MQQHFVLFLNPNYKPMIEATSAIFFDKLDLSKENPYFEFPDNGHNRIYLYGHTIGQDCNHIYMRLQRKFGSTWYANESRESIFDLNDFRTRYLWKASRIVKDAGDKITLSCGIMHKKEFVPLDEVEGHAAAQSFSMQVRYAMFTD